MTTAGDIINKALRRCGVLGVGQTAQAQDIADALSELNQMIDQWAQRRWLVYHLVEFSHQMDGSLFYTVGPGQNFDMVRPGRIEAAFMRQTAPETPTPVDWPLEIIESYEEYSRIALKSMTAGPSEYLFYDSGFPTGKLYPWPVPNNQFALHIIVKDVLQNFPTANTNIVLPPAYLDAIDWNMRARLRSGYRLPIDPFIIGQSKATLRTVRTMNLQLDQLRMPRGITGGPAYNIYSDRGD